VFQWETHILKKLELCKTTYLYRTNSLQELIVQSGALWLYDQPTNHEFSVMVMIIWEIPLCFSLSLSSGFKFLHFIMQTAFLSHGRTPHIVMTGNENKCDDNDLQLHDRVWTNTAHNFFYYLVLVQQKKMRLQQNSAPSANACKHRSIFNAAQKCEWWHLNALLSSLSSLLPTLTIELAYSAV
jgi:hypothetical protein